MTAPQSAREKGVLAARTRWQRTSVSSMPLLDNIDGLALLRVVALSVIVGCARPVLESPPATCPGICSEGSTYAPTMRLLVTMTGGVGSLAVTLDSGIVRIPGSGTEGPSLMEHLFIRAFVAVALDPGEANSVREHAWRALAWSDSVPLADALRYGESRSVPRHVFHMVWSGAQAPSDAWLGFSITGDAVNPRARTPSQRLIRGGVRVFACDPRQLSGIPDASRVARLRDSYSAVC